MMKGNIKYIVMLVTAVALVIIVEWLTPKPINWTPTFMQEDKNPFGSYILYDLLPDIFPNKKVITINAGIYERNEEGNLLQGNHIFICQNFNPGKEEIEILLGLVNNGSNIFIASGHFPQLLADTLVFKTENVFFTSDSIGLNLENGVLHESEFYQYKRIESFYAFTTPKGKKATFQTLGSSSLQRPNFIGIPFGKGFFYLNTMPLAYTNYNMLYKQNAEYISKTLSYLPVQDTYWDEYYKEYRQESQTPLRFFLSRPPLQWALYVAVGALLLFIAFEAKRKQRMIPIVKPLSNTTLEFTETVGRLYFQYKDHKNIAEKKIIYFLDYLRTHFYVKVTAFDDALYTRLSEKSGVDKDEIVGIFKIITYIQSQKNIREEELLRLNQKIEDFQRKSK